MVKLNPRTVLRGASLAVILTLAPFTVTARGHVQRAAACAQRGTACCEQINTVCSFDGHDQSNACFSGTGTCLIGPAPCT
jgi:hypothetical protein